MAVLCLAESSIEAWGSMGKFVFLDLIGCGGDAEIREVHTWRVVQKQALSSFPDTGIQGHPTPISPRCRLLTVHCWECVQEHKVFL